MGFGEIIKKAWNLTWTYRRLWVLGVFAGATGGAFGFGRWGTSSSSSRSSSSTTGLDKALSGRWVTDPAYALEQVQHALPAVLMLVAVAVLVGIAMAVISTGARGALVWAVNEVEEGRSPTLSDAWDAGFSRFWSIVGLGILLQLPVALFAAALVGTALLSVLALLGKTGSASAPALIAPACGALGLGVPVLLVGSFVLGVMYLTGLRFVMLGGMGAVDAAREAWRALRARLADHFILSVLTYLLNSVAGLIVAVPVFVVSAAIAIPAVLSIRSGGLVVGVALFGLLGLILIAVILLFAGIWSTLTSAIWTIFYRRLTGREVPVGAVPAASMQFPTPPTYAPPSAPQPPPYGTPPWPPQPPAGPPMAPPAPPDPGTQPPSASGWTPNE